MDASQKAALIEAGVNVEGALPRFMGKEAMLEKYLKKFLSEKSFPGLVDAMSSKDYETAALQAHTHKSVSGSIGCDTLHAMLVEQEAALKGKEFDKAEELMPRIKSEHDKIVSAIKETLGE